MTEKSFVSIERRRCVICAESFETGALLLDRRLRQSMEPHTTTGWGLCAKDRDLFQQGYVALVECDAEKSGDPDDGERVSPNDVYRTGKIAHIKRDVAEMWLQIRIPRELPCVFVEVGYVDEVIKATTKRS